LLAAGNSILESLAGNRGLQTFPGEVRRTADPSASLGMTKGRVTLP
jgi:hypothetical protein